MDWNSAALVPYRMRTVRIGVHLTLVTAVILLVFRTLPGRGPMHEGGYMVLLTAALAGGALVAVIPWQRLFERGLGVWALYAWSCGDILLISAAIALTGGGHSHLYLLYALTSVFFSASYPPKGQTVLMAGTIASYIGAVLLSGGELPAGALFVRVAVIMLITYLTLFLSKELMREMLAHHAMSDEARRRSELLAIVAHAGETQSLDSERALAAILDAVQRLGFAGACVHLLDETGLQFRVGYARGLPPVDPDRWWPATEGVTPLVREAEGTVVIDDYRQSPAQWTVLQAAPPVAVVASPIWVKGKLVGVLVGGTDTPRAITAGEIEAFELLAVQAGFALENAELAQGLRRSEARFRSLVQNASDVVCVADATGRLTYASPAVDALLGYDANAIAGGSMFAAVHRDDLAGLQAQFERLLRNPAGSEQSEIRLRHRDGSSRWVEAIFTNLLHDPSVAGVVVNFRDTTERKAFEEQLRYQAFHDSLTGLPNRAQVMQRIAQSSPANGSRLAVLLLDLDGFKTVNDSLGHEMGDQLLIAATERLRSVLRPGELLARLGGDEFTILVDDPNPEPRAVELAEDIASALAWGFQLGSRFSVQTASIGIALSSAGGRGGADLLRRADLAMYTAKERGKAQYVLFDALMSERAEERLQLESELRQALKQGELYLDYQPLVSLDQRRIEGVEALVRWRHPQRGIVSPSEFIPLAEETGLILPIGRWVIEESCRQLTAWGPSVHGSFYISVNVSPRQFSQPGFCHELQEVLTQCGVAARSLQLEITESVLMENGEHSRATLEELREIGVRLAIDDFGTGYSSLSYLRQYPVDVLKVDRSFVESIATEPEARALVTAITGLARTLNLTTVAEGIESEAQFDQLLGLQCDFGQGFYFARPMSPAEIAALLRPGAQAA